MFYSKNIKLVLKKLAQVVNSKSPVTCGLQNPVNPPGDKEQALVSA